MIVMLLATVLSLFGMLVANGVSDWADIKDNWEQHRCNPMYIPVAGFINPKVSAADNFTHCTNSMAGNFWGIIVDQINVYFGVLGSSLNSLTKPLSGFRSVITNIRKFMFTFMAQSMSKAAGSTSVFIHYLNKIQDVMKRFVAQGYIGAFLTQTLASFAWAFIMLFMSVLKTFVYIMLGISIVLALFQPAFLVLVIILASLIGASGF
jgi:hypothetical protein